MRKSISCMLISTISRPLGWIILFSCFLNISFLSSPLYMMQVYDRVLHSKSVPTLIYLTLVVGFVYAISSVLDAVRSQILAGISDDVEDFLARRLLSNVVAPHEHDGDRAGATQITRDLDTVRQYAAGSAVLAFVDFPWAPIYLAVLFLLHWKLGVFALLISTILAAISFVGERLARQPMSEANVLAVQSQVFGESIVRNAHCVSTMGLGSGVADRWRALRSMMLAKQACATDCTILVSAVAKFVRLFTQSAILGLGAYLAINHEVSGGSVFAGSLLLGRCLSPVEAVIANWRSTVTAYLAFGRILSVLSPEEMKCVTLPDPKGELAAERITWSPHGIDRPALSDVTLSLAAGTILAVVGPNAAGKSTLGRVLAGAMRPNSGIVRLDGAELASWTPAQLGKAIGYLPQDPSLFPGTIRDNIARFTDASDLDVVTAAQAAMVHDMITHLRLGYQTPVDEIGISLSGGQRQRIALARALLFDPPVLILDEPSASLDADGESALINCIVKAKQRRHTVIVITHSVALVRVADHVATMMDGRVIRLQRTTEFFARPVAAVANGAR